MICMQSFYLDFATVENITETAFSSFSLHEDDVVALEKLLLNTKNLLMMFPYHWLCEYLCFHHKYF